MSSKDNFPSPIVFAEKYEFEMTDPTQMTFKVIEITSHEDYDPDRVKDVISQLTANTIDKLRSAPTQINPHLKTNMIVTLVSGKWPLSDYRDNDGTVIHQFKTSDGTQFSTILNGFDFQCTGSVEKQIQNFDEYKPSFCGVLLVLKED